MPTSYRPIRADEWPAYVALDAYAFGYEPTPAAVERLRALRDFEDTLAAVEHGRIVAQLHVAGMPLWINGGPMLTGMVADVATAPEHRRKGHIGDLLRAALARMRDRGQTLSALHPSFYPLYQRFGWTLAAVQRRTSGAAAGLLLPGAPPPGHIERLDAADLAAYTPIYDAALTATNSALGRSPAWWQYSIAYQRTPGSALVARWHNTAGDAQGYLLYDAPRDDPATHLHTLQVRELVALTPDAYRGLLHFLALHDLVKPFHWSAPEDDPLPALLPDPRRISMTLEPGFMLRIVDLPAALAARACLDPGPLRLTLAVRDQTAPWNDGIWGIERDSGTTRVRRTDAPPDLALDITTLAALLNGFLSPAQALSGGLLDVHAPSSLAAAGRFFAVTRRPFAADTF